MLEVGTSAIDITPPVGGWIQNAAMMKKAASIRDRLEASALYFSDGSTRVVIVGVDVVALEADIVARARERACEQCELSPHQIIVTCTHTHLGPRVIPSNYELMRDEEYLDRVATLIARAAVDAIANARPARIGWGLGHAPVGHNRRMCWADGTHTMHGDPTRDDFTGFEGPTDPRHAALVAFDDDNRPRAILHANSVHATTLIGSEYYSADFPGEARRMLREVYGDIPVLFLNGGMGDQAPYIQVHRGAVAADKEAMCKQIGWQLAAETMRLMFAMTPADSPTLGHRHDTLSIPTRVADPTSLDADRALLKRLDDGETVHRWEVLWAHGRTLLAERFPDGQPDDVEVHSVRVGDVVISTNPCELFNEYAHDLKRRMGAPVPIVCDLANGYSGYCPTMSGVLGGGYSGDTIYWTRLAPDAGYRIVDACARQANVLMRV